MRTAIDDPCLLYTTGQEPRGNLLLAALPADTLGHLEGSLRHVLLEPGAIIVEPGDPVENIYFPQTGLISLLIVTRNGSWIATGIVGREGAVGLHPGVGERRSFTRSIAQVGGVFSIVSAAKFELAIGASHAAQEVIFRYTELLCAEAQQLAACNALHNASSRFCRCLLQIADRTGSDCVPLIQEDLAQMLGVRRTSVTLLAQALQHRDIVRCSRGRIAILDRPALAASACECYHVTQHDELARAIGLSPGYLQTGQAARASHCTR